MQICPTHGIPTTIPGMCQACVADAQTPAAMPPIPTERAYDPSIIAPESTLTDAERTRRVEQDRRVTPEVTGPGPDGRDAARAADLMAPIAREPLPNTNRGRPPEPASHQRPHDTGHHKKSSSHGTKAAKSGAKHAEKERPAEPRPPKRDPDRPPSGHPRGTVEFYCGNCCVLSFTPGYCTACGAMLKALDTASERHRQPGDHDHHLLPSAFDRSIGFWEKRGIDRNEFCVSLPAKYHHQVHRLWNDEWAWFIMDHPDATAERIRAQMYSMIKDYGLEQFRIHGYRSEG
jgi:hypothetical protein